MKNNKIFIINGDRYIKKITTFYELNTNVKDTRTMQQKGVLTVL